MWMQQRSEREFRAIRAAGALLGVSVVITAGFGGGAVHVAQPAAGPLTIDLLLDIRHPSSPVWSPDGTQVAFVWDRSGVQNVWIIGVPPGAGLGAAVPDPPRALTPEVSGTIQTLFWGPDGREVLYALGGTLWRADAAGRREPAPAWASGQGGSGYAPSPNGELVAFSRAGDLWVRSLATGEERRLTNSAGTAESGPVWSPDGRRIAFGISSSVRRSHAPDFHGTKILFAWTERTSLPEVAVVTVGDGSVVPTASSPAAESQPAWIDSERLVVQRIDEDYRTREILVAAAASGKASLLHRDVDAKWWGLTYNGATPLPSPDGRWVAFLSDRDGWDHAYVVGTSGGTATQLTKGPFEVARLAWSPDSTRLAFDTNEGGPPGRKQIATIEVTPDGSPGRIAAITRGRGTAIDPVWSPRGDRLLYQHSDGRNSADFFVVSGAASAVPPTPARLTDSMPGAIDRSRLVEPELVFYSSTDGRKVPASLFVPRGLDRSRTHPAIVWIHGDLVTQNYEGWHVRRDYGVYYSFHQYLLQRGYVVLAPDYRGSTGYGREWRQGVYRDLGGQEYRDVASAVEYLRSLGYVDVNRVGVWGLSYGGFLTLQALTTDPALFRCGVDVAGVTDYGDYLRDPGQPWLTARMGTRADNPRQYEQAAPIRRAPRITRPLLVLGGTADTNVPYEQTVRLIDELLKAGRDVEFMMYPGELHYFHRAHVLRDAWTRVERFFDEHLRPTQPASSASRR
jgi:dipeptidyl aminopeptidase/acylaminoacyl peptidase